MAGARQKVKVPGKGPGEAVATSRARPNHSCNVLREVDERGGAKYRPASAGRLLSRLFFTRPPPQYAVLEFVPVALPSPPCHAASPRAPSDFHVPL